MWNRAAPCAGFSRFLATRVTALNQSQPKYQIDGIANDPPVLRPHCERSVTVASRGVTLV